MLLDLTGDVLSDRVGLEEREKRLPLPRRFGDRADLDPYFPARLDG